jgi:hypothetical protein
VTQSAAFLAGAAGRKSKIMMKIMIMKRIKSRSKIKRRKSGSRRTSIRTIGCAPTAGGD